MKKLAGCRGQSLIEFALIMPLVLVVALGVIETGYALLDQHVVTKLSREGSNLISRDTIIDDAANAMRNMNSRPVDFDTRSRFIFSVLKKGASTGTPNYDKIVLYQRYEYGALTGVPSGLHTRGTGSFTGSPDYVANNSDTDTNLQIDNLPASLTMVRGGLMYVTEVYTRHNLITPLDRFGVTLPNTLYSIAYF
jgi:Flp pilus assembly protein TadG